jgi:mono/diheme cytochrome c family protein
MDIRHSGLAVVLTAVIACSGNGGGEASPEAAQPAAPSQQVTAAPQEAPPSGPIDEALAEQGEKLFQSKGCIGCHTIGGGRLSGPDLQGATDRREYGWFVAMVTNPDSMLKNDATARQLLQEYMTPMMNMGVSQTDARAIYEHIREESGAGER